MVNRYRSLMLLVAVLFGQLLLMAYQLRRKQDVPLVRGAVVYVVAPVQRGMARVVHSSRDIWMGYVSLWGTRQQNQALNRENDDLKLENQRLREQAAEGRRLQVLFDLREQLPLPTIAARVLSAGSSETARIILIDKGANDGLKPDLPVMVPDGAVGKILHLFPATAQVLLITDPYSGVACLLQDSRVHGILKGQNKPLCSLTYVPNGEEVKPGQMVFTSGEDQVYPKGLPLGVVTDARPGSEFQQISVRPLAQLNRLEEVLVILQSGGEIANFPVTSTNSSGNVPGDAPSGQSPSSSSSAGTAAGPAAGSGKTPGSRAVAGGSAAGPQQSLASPTLTGNLPQIVPAAPRPASRAPARPSAATVVPKPTAPKPAAPAPPLPAATAPAQPPQQTPEAASPEPPTPPESAAPDPPEDATPNPPSQ